MTVPIYERSSQITREKRKKRMVINLKRIFTSNKQKSSPKDLRKTIIYEHATSFKYIYISTLMKYVRPEQVGLPMWHEVKSKSETLK